MLSRYSKIAITLHWLMAVMIIGNLAGGFLNEFLPRNSPERATVMGLHVSFGLTIIALTLVRIGWRLANPPPPLPAYFTGGERLLAKGTHWALYIAMLALPMSGWLMAERNERPLLYFFVAEVPKAGIGKPLAQQINEVHEILGWAMLVLLALHVLGVIRHLVMDRDNLLPRMGIGQKRGVGMP